MMQFFGIMWAKPEFLWMGCIVVLACGLLVYRMRMHKRMITFLAGAHNDLIMGYSSIKQYLKVLLMGLGIVSLWLALLRPQWHKRQETIAQEGRDLVIALDISRSMLATDVGPDRLTCAKKKIKQLLSKLECERVALILFSGKAFVQCPLTADYSVFHMFLDHVDDQTISSGSTELESALKRALDMYDSNTQSKSKLLIILTDGEDFSSNLKKYKQQAQDNNLHVFTMGIGTAEGAPIPLYDEHGKHIGHQKDDKNNVVISRLNEHVLHSLARDVGGSYISLTRDTSDLDGLVQKIKRFEKDSFEDKKITQFDDKYPYFLMVSFICFAVEWLL